jgi:hypothetical protein
LHTVEKRGANSEPYYPCFSSSNSMCILYSTLVQQMKHSYAHPSYNWGNIIFKTKDVF